MSKQLYAATMTEAEAEEWVSRFDAQGVPYICAWPEDGGEHEMVAMGHDFDAPDIVRAITLQEYVSEFIDEWDRDNWHTHGPLAEAPQEPIQARGQRRPFQQAVDGGAGYAGLMLDHSYPAIQAQAGTPGSAKSEYVINHYLQTGEVLPWE